MLTTPLTTLVVTVMASAAFALAAPPLSRTLPPAVATWLMAGGGFLAAATTSTALALVGFRVLAQTEPLTDQGHWSDAVLADRAPISAPMAVTAVALLTVLLAAGVRTVLARAVATVTAFRVARDLGGGELAVLDAPAPSALAVPGRPGRIVVSSGMLRRLDAGQRRALLAHERTHLRQHHHLYLSMTAVAVSLNPLLRPLLAAVELSCERWADEAAAGSSARSTVAEALLRAATSIRPASPAVALAASGADVAARVAALGHPAPTLRVGRALGLVSVLLVAVAAVAWGMVSTEHLFEVAQAAWRAGQH